jgi:hypothetical protein
MTRSEASTKIGYDAVTSLQYLDPATQMNRRYLAPGSALNTGKFEWKDVVVRDARPTRSEFSLEKTGFALIDHKSEVRALMSLEPVHFD